MSPNQAHDSIAEDSIEPSTTERVVGLIRAQLGKPYKLGTEGPDTFDCSGLIWYGFNTVGVSDLIGGGRHRANWYYHFFTEQGLFSARISDANRGDLVFYGHKGPDNRITHMGIYLGNTNHKVISALQNPWGVSRTRVSAITVPVIGFGLVPY